MVAALCAWASRASILPREISGAARILVSPAPLSPLAGWSLLAVGAVAPHRAFVKVGSRVVLRFARIPKIRRVLQRKWPIWGKLLLKNKMRAEVTSYRLAINEAWESLEGTVPSDQLHAMREAERDIRAYGRGADPAGSGADDTEWSDPETSPTGIERATARGSTSRSGKSSDGDDSSSPRFPPRADGDGKAASSPRLDLATVPRARGGWSWNAGRATVTSEASTTARVEAAEAPRRRPRSLVRAWRAATGGAHRVFVATPSSLVGVLTGREFGAELHAPPPEQMIALRHALRPKTDAAFSDAHRAAFLLQHKRDARRAARAMEKSARWRADRAFLPRHELRRFEDVIFTHGGRNAYTGGTHLVLRLSAVWKIERELGYDAVVAAILSHVEQQWTQLGLAGDNPGKVRGRLVALVDCAGVTPGTFPASLVATTLSTLDSNYPELAAEVHVVNVWWLVKRMLSALLETTSKSTRERVRIYRNDDTGVEKLGIRFAQHVLPACFPKGKCSCRTCRRMTREGMAWNGHHGAQGTGEFAHGGLMGRYYRWELMSSAQRRQYLRHLFFYYLGIVTFWPVHIFRVNAHPFLVTIIHARKMLFEFLRRLRRGDPFAVFVATLFFFTSLAFVMASLAWWAEYGSALLIQSMRNPPRTFEEAWVMHGLFKRSIGASLEESLGLEVGTLGGAHADPHTMMEDGGWL